MLPTYMLALNVKVGRMVCARALLLILLFVTSPVWARNPAWSFQRAKGFSWATHSSKHFKIFAEKGSLAEREFQTIIGVLEKSHADIEALLGHPLKGRTEYFLVSSRARMKELVGIETNGLAVSQVSLGVYNETTKAIGSHELCHGQARRLWGPSQGVWISEGVAVYSDNNWHGHPLHLLAKWLLDRDKLVPLADLIPDGWLKNRKYSDLITYPELGSFVKFTYERYGREAVKALWQQGPTGALKGAGKPLEELEREWRAELARLDASSLDYRL